MILPWSGRWWCLPPAPLGWMMLVLCCWLLYLDGDIGRRLGECKSAVPYAVPDFLGNVLLEAITLLVSD